MRVQALDKANSTAEEEADRAGVLAFPVTLALLALGGAVTRLAFVRSTPINWDAVQFELALGHFDLQAHQPHPPGYLLYVLAGKAVNTAVNDPTLALSLLSVIACAIALPLIYLLALRIFEDSGIALGAALLLMGSPLALYYGAVGLTYLPEMAFSIGIALLAWKYRVPSTEYRVSGRPEDAWYRIRGAFLLGATLGLAGGVRQTSILVLLPLCLWALWRAGRKVWLAFGAAALVTCAAWLVPLLVMSGGPAAYLRESALLAQTVSERTSPLRAGLEGLGHNLGYEALGLALGLAFALVPLGLWALRLLRFSLARPVKGFFVWWTVPPLAFFALTHLGQYGYMLVVLPPLVLLAAVCVRVLANVMFKRSNVRTFERFLPAGICAGLALLSWAFFLTGSGPVTASAITSNDEHWNGARAALAGLNPAHTVLVSTLDWEGSFRAAGYLLPQFHTYAMNVTEGEPHGWLYSAYGGRSTYALPHPPVELRLPLPAQTDTLVMLDEKLGTMFDGVSGLERIPLAGGDLAIVRAPGSYLTGIVLVKDRLHLEREPIGAPAIR